MATTLVQFRPTIWSRQLIVDIDKALVFRNVVNTRYEGEITAYGNTVKINEIGDVAVNDYTEGSDMTVQSLDGAQKELLIDKKKYFYFSVDDVLAAQANVSVMQAAMQKAAHAVADTIDQAIADLYSYAGITSTALGDTSTGIDMYAAGEATDGLLYIINYMHQALDEKNAPTQGRWAVIPPWMHLYLKYAGLIDNVSGAIKNMSGGNYGNGYIGNLLGIDWYASNNVSNDGTPTDYYIMFGTPDAISFAGQVVKMESDRMEKQFGDYVRGLYVYGMKVVRPDHLGTAYLAAGGLTT